MFLRLCYLNLQCFRGFDPRLRNVLDKLDSLASYLVFFLASNNFHRARWISLLCNLHHNKNDYQKVRFACFAEIYLLTGSRKFLECRVMFRRLNIFVIIWNWYSGPLIEESCGAVSCWTACRRYSFHLAYKLLKLSSCLWPILPEFTTRADARHSDPLCFFVSSANEVVINIVIILCKVCSNNFCLDCNLSDLEYANYVVLLSEDLSNL